MNNQNIMWKHKYSLPSGGNCVVFGNSTDKISKVVINGVKQGGHTYVFKRRPCK